MDLAQWLSWLERRPVTAEVVGSSPIWVVPKREWRAQAYGLGFFFFFLWDC